MKNNFAPIIASNRPRAIVRLILLAISGAIFIIALSSNFSFSPVVIPDIAVWWIIILAAALLIIALTFGSSWGASGFFAGSLLVGSSAQLSMTSPQMFQSIVFGPLSSFLIATALAICLQALATLFVLFNKQTIVKAIDFFQSLGLLKVILWSMVFGLFSITVMKHVQKALDATIVMQYAVGTSFLFLNMATAIALALKLPKAELASLSAIISSWFSFPGDMSEGQKYDRVFPYAAALFILIATIAMSFLAFQNIPHVEDELAHIFQAQYFSQGKLSLAAPALEIVPAFEYYLIPVFDGKWYSMMFPGWPMALSLGYVFGTPWLVGPLLAALSVLFAHNFTARISDRGTANVMAALVAISPWFIASSATYMQHTVTVATTLAAWILILISREQRSATIALASGCLMGYLFLTRPVEALIIGTLTGLWLLPTLFERKGWLMVAGYGLGCILVASLMFFYNYALLGEPFLTPLNHYLHALWGEGANRFGFGPDIGPIHRWKQLDAFPGHSPWEALVNFQHNGYMLNNDLFGWSIGSLGFMIFHFIWGKKSRFDTYMMAIIVLIVGIYGFYWFVAGFYIGPRYWFGAFVPFVLLSTKGLISFAEIIREKMSADLAVQRFVCVIVVLTLFSTASFLTWRGTFKYYEFRRFHTGYRELVKNEGLQEALLFLTIRNKAELGSAFALNSPTFDKSSPLFARDLGPVLNLALAEAFPNRPIYFLESYLKMEPRVRIVKGPLTLEDLRADVKNR